MLPLQAFDVKVTYVRFTGPQNTGNRNPVGYYFPELILNICPKIS
jgi:hypothetical protein